MCSHCSLYEKIQKGWRSQQQLRTEISALQLDNDEDNDYARWSGVFEVTEDIPLPQGIALIGTLAAALRRNPGWVFGENRHSSLSHRFPLNCFRCAVDDLSWKWSSEDAAPAAPFGEGLMSLLANVIAPHLLKG